MLYDERYVSVTAGASVLLVLAIGRSTPFGTGPSSPTATRR